MQGILKYVKNSSNKRYVEFEYHFPTICILLTFHHLILENLLDWKGNLI
jgi:hypothetical protein